MPRERAGTATVIEQDGDRVRVEYEDETLTVPMEGFPSGFRLRPGEGVILLDESSGTVARPLVRAITSRIEHEVLKRRGRLQVDDRTLVLQDSTVVEEPEGKPDTGEAREHVLWIVEPGEAEGPGQVIAAGRRPRSR